MQVPKGAGAPAEREIKLRVADADAGRAAAAALGATAVKPRRLQDDLLLDDEAGTLREQGCALRVRRDGEAAVLTWKGPVQASDMKVREEVETTAGSAEALLDICRALGYAPRFRYQKFRTEFALPGLIIAVDETPIGCFIELEGTEDAIGGAVARLGAKRDDFILASYRTLFLEWRTRSGSSAADMLFDHA